MGLKSRILIGSGLAAGVAGIAILTGQFSGDETEPPSAPVLNEGHAPVVTDKHKAEALKNFGDVIPKGPAPDTNDVARLSLATMLLLPVNGTAHYYNRGTNTAFAEACSKGGARSISCTLDVLNMTAQIRHTVKTTYELDPQSNILTLSEKTHAENWTNDSTLLYDSIKAEVKAKEPASGSPLTRRTSDGDVIKNSMYEISTYGQGGVALCSVVPVSSKRMIDVCVSFDKAGHEVRSAAMPQLSNTGAMNQILVQPQAALRDFSSDDRVFLDKYRAQIGAGGRPAYIVRPD